MGIGKVLWWTTVGPVYVPYVVAKELGTPLVSIASGVAAHWKKEAKPHDAKFADKSALKNGGYRNPGGFIPGKDNGAHVHLDPERSAIIFGQAGTGKTLTTIANVKARRDTPDMVFCDPAGDILQGVEKDLVIRGYEIIKIDLTEPLKSARYSPMTYLRPECPFDFPRDVISVCDLMMEAAHMNDVGMHFLESGRNMLKSMIAAHHKKELGEIVVRLLVEKDARTKTFERMRASSQNIVKQGVEAFCSARVTVNAVPWTPPWLESSTRLWTKRSWR